MDNWKYLVDTVRDLSWRDDRIPEVLRALSFVLDERGHGMEAMAALKGARLAEEQLGLSYADDDEDDDDDDFDEDDDAWDDEDEEAEEDPDNLAGFAALCEAVRRV